MSNAKKTSKVLPDLSQMATQFAAMQTALAALSAENETLKKTGGKTDSITLGDYQGHATVTFALAGKRPFYISVNKLKGIFANEKTVKALIAGK